jgi:putative tryptophan/tyrosine transport system substrate-binding protein
MLHRRGRLVAGLAIVVILLVVLAACGGGGGKKVPVIGFMQFSNNDVQDPAREGFVKALQEAGYKDGSTAKFIFKNAQADLPTMQLIAKDLNQQADVVLVVSTQALQAALGTVKEKPIIFAAVADPKTAGAGESAENHLANVAGAPSTAPMREALEVVREALPQARQLGVIYDPASANSVFYLDYIQKKREGLGLDIVTMAVNSSTEVQQAAQALAAKGIDAFFVITDPFVLDGFDSVVKVAHSQKLPIFATVPNLAGKGAAVALGWDYFENGHTGGQIAARVLKGEKPGAIAFQFPTKYEIAIDPDAAEEQGLKLPQSIIARAQRVVGK